MKQPKFKEISGYWVVMGVIVWVISVTMDWNTKFAAALWLISGMVYLIVKVLQPMLKDKAEKAGERIGDRLKKLSDE